MDAWKVMVGLAAVLLLFGAVVSVAGPSFGSVTLLASVVVGFIVAVVGFRVGSRFGDQLREEE
ncbi:MAG: hypothetical protein ABEJ04_01600 [Halobacteriaceae archaeon]